MSEAAQTTTTTTTEAPATGAAGGSESKTAVTSIITAPTEGGDQGVTKTDTKADGAAGETKVETKTEEKPYALEVPKDYEQHVDKAALEKFTAFAKAEGVSVELANKLLKFDLERRAADVQASDKLIADQSAAWLDEVKKDPELGGTKLNETMASVGRALTKFGDAALRKDLVALGMQNHPGLVRMIAKVGAALAEDSGIISGASGGGGAARRESIYDPS